MNKGDTIQIILDFTINDEPLVEGAYDEIELQFNKQSAQNGIKLLMSDGRIEWDGEHYVATLTQKETMKLTSSSEYQVRIAINGMVISSDIGKFGVGDVLSSKIL